MGKENDFAMLLAETVSLQLLLEQQTGEWVKAYRGRGGTIHCSKGCSNCCRLAVHCSFPEAALIAKQLPAALQGPLERYVEQVIEVAGSSGSMKGYLSAVRDMLPDCPFLGEAGHCTTYTRRPLSCRSLLSTADPRYCAADLSKLTPRELDELNGGLDAEVSRLPTPHVEISQQLAQQLESLLLAKMEPIAGLSLSGNLPYLVWVERRYGLADRFSGDRDEAVRFLEMNGLNRRYLIDLR